MKNYIIGYGSLINFESQNVTGVSTWSKPIWLLDHERQWNVNYDEMQFCALGVYSKKGSQINAVIFCVETKDDLDQFDRREHGYTRNLLLSSQIKMWNENDEIPQDGPIWIYYPNTEKIGKPQQNHFIWQSYLDVILMGCLSMSKEFGEQFVHTTQGWSEPIIKNDRQESLYLKKLMNYDTAQIDDVIKLIGRTS